MPALHTICHLHSAGRLKPHGAEDAWPKTTATEAWGQTLHIAVAGSLCKRQTEKLPVGFYSLNSKPFPLSAKASETMVWKHTCNVRDPCSRYDGPWIYDLLRSLATIWFPSLSTYGSPNSTKQRKGRWRQIKPWVFSGPLNMEKHK